MFKETLTSLCGVEVELTESLLMYLGINTSKYGAKVKHARNYADVP